MEPVRQSSLRPGAERVPLQATVPRAGWIAAGMGAIAVVGLLYVGRHLNFYWDEWTFINERNLPGIAPLFAAHNEHWSTIPLLIYHGLFATVGLRAYWPYLLVLELLHAGSAFLLFTLVRRRCGDLLGLAAMAVLLCLGRGAENILWAFQLSFVGSVFFGLLAMVLLDRPRANRWQLGAASVALLASLMSSGMGLFFCAAVAVFLLVDRARWPRLAVLALPAAAYLAWFIPIGFHAASHHRSPFSLTALTSIVGFVPFGIGSGVAGVLGLGSRWSPLLLPIAAAALALVWYRRRGVASLVLAALAGLLAQFALIGLVRAQFGDQQAASGRYVYVAAVFLLVIAADALRDVRIPPIAAAGLALAFVFCVGYSGFHLVTFARDRNAIMVLQKAELQTLEVFRGSPRVDMNVQVDDAVMQPVYTGKYYDAIDQLGSPVPKTDLKGLETQAPSAVDQAVRQMFGKAVIITPAHGLPGTGCAMYQNESTVNVNLLVGQGAVVTVESSTDATLGLTISWLANPSVPPQRQVSVIAQSPVQITMPQTNQAITWRLRLTLPASGQTTICGGGPA